MPSLVASWSVFPHNWAESSENFPGDFEVNQRLRHKHGKASKTIHTLKILKLLVLLLMRPSPYELQPAGELQGIMPKIYCERCWLILEDIEMIFLKQNDMWFSVSVMVLVLHVILILHS